MYVSAVPQSLISTEQSKPGAEKRRILKKLEVLIISSGNRTRAFQYSEDAKQALHPDAVQIGVRALEHLISS
jgi:hypothetical protein